MQKQILFIGIFLQLFMSTLLLAQVPQRFNYQGIARDAAGNPLTHQTMTIKLAILPTADATTAEYEESQTIKTNEFGLYTLQIGNGTPLFGNMKTVKWETGNKYIQVAIDPNGGTNYTDAGTSQLLSVPYAIYAEKAGEASQSGNDKTRTGTVNSNAAHNTGDINYITKFTALNTLGKSLLFDNGNSVGIGTATPSALAKLHLYTNTGNVEHLRMQNIDANGFGKFTMYNDVAGNYATFTKYGSTFSGGYAGVVSQYPFANMLAFGNNNGASMFATSGNVGIAIIDNGVTKLKFNAHKSTGYVGIGGNAVPAAKIHFNTSTTNDTIKFTNATTGHTANDGFEIRTNGTNVRLINEENAKLFLGTNNADRVTITGAGNVGIGTANPSDLLHIAGIPHAQVRIHDSNDHISLYLSAPNPSGNSTGGIGTDSLDLPLFTGGFDRMTIKQNGKIGIATSLPDQQVSIGDYTTTQNQYLSIRTAGGNQFVSGIQLKHFDDNTGWVLESDEPASAFRINHLNSFRANKKQFKIDIFDHLFIGDSVMSLNDTASRIFIGHKYSSSIIRLGENATNFLTMGWIKLTQDSSESYASIQSQGGNPMILQRDGGKIGIGHISPDYSIDIKGLSVDDASDLQLSNVDQSHFLRLFGGSSIDPNASIWWKDGNPLRFATDAGGFSEKMRINSNGYVGIGTSLPTTQLDIEGQVRIRGGVPGAGKILTSDANGTATWENNTSPAHYIGESYGGGIVFYVYDNGQHGLIAAPTDQDYLTWNNGINTTTNAVRDGIGAGKFNTERIIINQGVGGYGAQSAANFQGDNYGDWYLPSKYELNLLYAQKTVVGGFVNDFYWSSTESSPTNAWAVNFTNGNQGNGSKAFVDYIRAIRSF